MNKFVAASAIALAMALAPAAQATTFNVGDPNFTLETGDPTSPTITASFKNAFSSTQDFDDTFEFTIPQNGYGSGSISTSFSGADKLVITDLIINGVSYALIDEPNGQSRTVGGIPIFNLALNTIRVIGTVTGSGLYSGTATFTAAAIPEPASWALMIVGFAAVGLAVRRHRPAKVSFS